jgi:hypothetical protein
MPNLQAGSLTFRSRDRKFGVVVGQTQIRALLKFASRSGYSETGGLLIGRYNFNRDRAFVTEILGPTSDSRAGHTWFVRGVSGLYSYLRTVWPRGQYYLGEWHFHPGAAPIASGPDLQQMLEISQSENYACPEPILLILGGDPKGTWQLNAYQFVRGSMHFQLEEETS